MKLRKWVQEKKARKVRRDEEWAFNFVVYPINQERAESLMDAFVAVVEAAGCYLGGGVSPASVGCDDGKAG